jgi:hypothetical protein
MTDFVHEQVSNKHHFHALSARLPHAFKEPASFTWAILEKTDWAAPETATSMRKMRTHNEEAK